MPVTISEKEISNSWRSKIVPNHPLKIIPKCSPRICTLCKTVTLPSVSESWRDKKKVERRNWQKKDEVKSIFQAVVPSAQSPAESPLTPILPRSTPTSQDHLPAHFANWANLFAPQQICPPAFLLSTVFTQSQQLVAYKFVHCLGFGTFPEKSLQIWNIVCILSMTTIHVQEVKHRFKQGWLCLEVAQQP